MNTTEIKELFKKVNARGVRVLEKEDSGIFITDLFIDSNVINIRQYKNINKEILENNKLCLSKFRIVHKYENEEIKIITDSILENFQLDKLQIDGKEVEKDFLNLGLNEMAYLFA